MFNLPDTLTGLFTPPVFEDKEKKRIAGWLNIILLCGLGLVLAAGIVNVATSPRPIPHFITACALLAWLSVHLHLYRKGYIRLVRLLFPITGWVMITLLVLFSGGINSPNIAGYVPFILFVGLIFGMRNGTGATVTMYEGVLLINPDGRIVQANPTAERILGRKRSEIEGRSYVSPEWEILRPDGTPMPPEEMAAPRAMKEKRPVNDVVMGVRRSDGSICWINVNAAPIMDAAGQLEAVVGTFADITARKQAEFTERKRAEEALRKAHDELEIRVQERVAELAQAHEGLQAEFAGYKRAEEELRKSDERYRTVVEDMPALICRFLPDGTLSFVNNAYCRYFSKTHEELVGHNFFQFIPVEDREKVREPYDSISKEKPAITYEHQVIAPDGTIRWQRWTARGLFDESGALVEYQSIVEDITERQQAEEAFAMERERPSTTPRGIGDGVIATDIDRQAVLINQAAETLTGRPQEEALQAEFTEYKQAEEALSNLIEIIQFTEHVSAKIHGLQDAAEIYRTVKEEFAQSQRYAASILLFTDDGSSLRIAESSLSPAKVEAGEKATGLRLKGYKIDWKKSSIHREVVREGKTVQAKVSDIIGELFPRPLAHLIPKIMGYEKKSSILTPLKRNGKIVGAFAMTCPELAEHFIPSVRNLAQHISNALEWADENSERKRAAEALRESRERYQELYNEAPVGYHEIDREGRIVQVNQTEADLLGFTVEEMIGQPVWDFLAPVQRDIAKKAVEEKLQEPQPLKDFDRRYVCKDGREIDVHITERQIVDREGQVTGIRSTLQDITERKRVEEELNESEKKYRDLVDNALVGVFKTDIRGNILYVNEALSRMLEFESPEELMSESVLSRYKHPEEREVLFERLKQEGTVNNFELEVLTKTGKTLNLLLSGTLRGDFMSGMIRDITERMRAKEALIRTNRALRLVSECNQALVREKNEIRLLDAICEIIVDIGGYRLAWVGLAEHDHQKTVRPVSWMGYEKGYLEPLKITWADTEQGRGPTGTAIRTGEPVIARDIPNDPAFAPWRKEALKRGYASSIALPLKIADQAIGALNIYSPEPDAFIDEELNLLRELGDDLAYGIMALRAQAERKQAEEEIKRVAEEWKTTFDSISDFVSIQKTDYKIVRVNKAFADALKMKPGELIGKQCYEIIHGTKEPCPDCPYEQVQKTKKPSTVEFFESNFERYIQVSMSPIIDEKGELTSAVHIVKDITERKRVEEALAIEQERLSTTLRGIGDGVITTDIDRQVVLINHAAETLTGWSQEEALGRPLAEVLTLVDETSGRAIDLPTIEILKDQVVVLPGQRATLISRSDSRIPISLSFSPLKDRESQVIGMVMDILDITERERLESEMLRSAKLESLGVLAGGLAHDFNNFLMSIMLNLSTARLYLRDDPKATGMLKDAEESTRRAREITQQLATLTRGGVPVKESRYLTPLLKEAVNFSLHGSLVRPWFRLEEELWPVEIDHGQINQVLNNLAINAMQAMPEGGTLTVTTDNVTVDEEHPRGPLRRGQYVEVALTDKGTGIPPEALDKIFDPYFTTKEKGSGLGLFSVYSIINKHNGWITVDSEVNQGTTFTFYLPAAEEAVIPPYSKESEAMRKIIAGTGRILVMDDDELIRKALGRLLDDLGFKTAYAPDGAAALELFKQAHSTGKPFRAAILDFSIPGGMGGVETLARMREVDPEAKAIVTSGYANAPVMAHYEDYGFQGRLAKPFTAVELSEVLKEVLRGK